MEDIFKDIEPMVYKSGLNIPYHWWAGDTASRFFVSIRDEQKIIGTKCQKCKKVFIPPRKTCPACFIEISDWVDVADTGTVEAFTVARRQLAALPGKAPVCFALIKLDGADTSLLHYIGGADLEKVRIGMKVKAKFSSERSGKIRDIEYFKPV